MALPNARNHYLKTQIETASKEQLVVMLFDGVIRFTEQARKAIAEENIEDSHHSLMRAQAIIMELICTIDKEKGGEVADGLMSLHAYAFNCLIVCNMKKDVAKIDEVQKIYRELREAWVGAMDTLGIAPGVSKPATPAAGTPAQQPAAAKPAAAATQAQAPQPTQAKPATGPGGIMASAAKPAPTLAAGSTQISAPAVPAQPTPAAPAATPPAPAPIPKANVYGMGKTAMLGAINQLAAKPSATPQLQPEAPAPAAGQQVVATGNANTAKQNAMLGAYAGGTRSIA